MVDKNKKSQIYKVKCLNLKIFPLSEAFCLKPQINVCSSFMCCTILFYSPPPLSISVICFYITILELKPLMALKNYSASLKKWIRLFFMTQLFHLAQQNSGICKNLLDWGPLLSIFFLQDF